MLILTRKVGETIVVGGNTDDEINITVLSVRGNQVRVGIDAPPHISVNREEIQIRIDQERKASGDR